MNIEDVKKLSSDKELLEKQKQILGLADDLLDAFKNSDMFRKGINNRQLFLDAMLGIGVFTCGILEAMSNSMGDKGKNKVLEFYKELLPLAYDMRQELNKEINEIEESKNYS